MRTIIWIVQSKKLVDQLICLQSRHLMISFDSRFACHCGKSCCEKVKSILCTFSSQIVKHFQKEFFFMESVQICRNCTDTVFPSTKGFNLKTVFPGEAIAQNLMEMSGLKTPIVSVVTGEGGSGGALALSVADRILMLSSSAYSVVSPEACASILWKDTERANEAAEALKLTAPDLLALGIIDDIVDDRGLSHEEIAGAIMSSAFDAFDTLGRLDDATLTNLRYEKYRAIGQYRTM